MGDEGGDGGPVVEHLAGERPDLCVREDALSVR
jgi:hypothetical protein